MSELEQQTDELQERLKATNHPEPTTLPETSWTAVNHSRNPSADNDSRLASVAPFFRQDAIAPVSFRSLPQAAAESSLETPESLPHDIQPSGTLPRSLDGQSVDSKDIDAMFQL